MSNDKHTANVTTDEISNLIRYHSRELYAGSMEDLELRVERISYLTKRLKDIKAKAEEKPAAPGWGIPPKE